MAVFSCCARVATAAAAATTTTTTRNPIAAATFAYVIRALSSSSSSSTLNPETDLNRNKPAVLETLKRQPNGRNVQWVFLGCPGVGKGTYASRLSNILCVPHIATGDLVRDELASSGPLSSQLKDIVSQGKLVSDEIIIDLLSKRLEEGGAKGESGFILDGFPRTIRQAEILEGVTDIDLVVNLKLREEALLAKCLGRRICSECGGNYNVASIDIKAKNGRPGMYMAPLPPPPQCATKLISRADDTEEVVKERLRIYHEMVFLHILLYFSQFHSWELN
ncbi:hypothetical protein REPUB_Repub13aG0064900 [Reevesia pubescens]